MKDIISDAASESVAAVVEGSQAGSVWVPEEVFCNKCGKKIRVHMNKHEFFKFNCPSCGAYSVMKIKSKGVREVRIFPPES